MSSVQNIESPRPQRPKHQHSRSATQVTQGPNGSTSNTNNSNNNGRQSQRRTRGNRAHNGHNQHGGPTGSPSRSPANPDPAFADSAVLSSEDMQLPTGPRTAKKHTRSQPSADRVFSPTSLPPASLTDTEGAPSHLSATPAKAQAAYAGPTFHASPAASALPIPKFLSKSVPAKARSGPPTPPPDETSDSGNSLSPSPSPSRGAPIPVPPRHEDSPLDMLFKADRAEKARNANCSPASVTTSNPSDPASAHGRPQHHKQDSFSSLNAVFPIELDGESKATHISPPPAASPGHRSVTAPSMLPQTDNSAMPNGGSDPIQDLFNRLSMSQKKPNAATPPGTINRVPSEPQSRHHSPSPFHDDRASFRSASGPTTPAPAAQEPSDFFYGNRNLSPLFKAAKNDSAKRNSGLRTEITADSPMMAKDTFHDFPSITPPNHADPNAVSRGFLENMVAGAPAGPRRGSAPHVQPPREMQNHNNNRKARTPGRTNNYHNYHPRPDSRSQANGNRTNGAPSTSAPKASTMMSFIPSSVAAKQHSTTPPLTKTPTPDTLALEQDLKRVLNLKLAGDMTGVR